MKTMNILTCCVLAAALTTPALAGPQPIGEATITVSYPLLSGGTYTATEPRNFNGTNPSAATAFGDASNMSMFSSVPDLFGRRAHVAQYFPEVILPSESLLTFSWYKLDKDGDYFPDIAADAVVTVKVEGVHFAEPVRFHEDTYLFHNLWDTTQFNTAILRGLFETDMHGHYFHTLTDPFRDTDKFQQVSGEFSPPGEMPHQSFGDIAPYITLLGDGTDTIGFIAEIPYMMFAHPHEGHGGGHQGDPYAGLPAPHGFLEPYHFHFETLVSAVPEPTTLALLCLGGVAIARRKLRRILGTVTYLSCSEIGDCP
jgi:hypothetical protein